MKKKAWGYIAKAVTLMLFGGAVAVQAEVQEVKIGFAAPLTEAQANYGKDMQNGVILAIEEMNATKVHIGGKEVKFVLISADDRADPKTATMVAQKLVDGGIKGMLGHFNSGTSIPASRIYSQAGIPQISMATAPEYTQQGQKTAFRMMTSDAQQGQVVGTFVVKNLGYKDIAIIDDRTAYGQGLADEFEKSVKAAGGKIVRREFTSDKSVDFKAILTTLKHLKPQVVFYGGAQGQSAPLVKQMRELGMTSVFVSGEMSKTDKFIKLAGRRAAEGVVVSLAGLPLEKMPGGRVYKEKYEKRFGMPVELYSPYAYDGTKALLLAMQKANSIEPAKYLPILAETHMLHGVTSNNIGYDAKGDLKDSSITLYTVKGGTWTVLESVIAK